MVYMLIANRGFYDCLKQHASMQIVSQFSLGLMPWFSHIMDVKLGFNGCVHVYSHNCRISCTCGLRATMQYPQTALEYMYCLLFYGGMSKVGI